MDATLFPGNPVTVTPQTFSGVGTTATATTVSAETALSQFQAAIGGVKNTAASPQAGGFRTITWDGVSTSGTGVDVPPNTIQINPTNPNGTVVIAKDRFIGQGVYFGDPYAVSGDGFTDVNPNVTGLFTPFSSPNVFAMVNGPNTIDLSFNLPTSANGTPVPAATRGFGAIFLNSELSASPPARRSNTSRAKSSWPRSSPRRALRGRPSSSVRSSRRHRDQRHIDTRNRHPVQLQRCHGHCRPEYEQSGRGS